MGTCTPPWEHWDTCSKSCGRLCYFFWGGGKNASDMCAHRLSRTKGDAAVVPGGVPGAGCGSPGAPEIGGCRRDQAFI